VLRWVRSWLKILLSLLGLAPMLSGELRAERFLTTPEAQKLSFPQADRFEPRVVRFTPDQIKAIQQQAKLRVLNKGNRLWLAWRGTNLLGVLVADYVLGKHELIDYVVAVGPDGRILRVEVLEYRESHGGEIRGQNWREQFRGKTATAPFRLHDDIYNISGATISCRNVSEGVRRVLATFDLVVRPTLPRGSDGPDGLARAGGLPDSKRAARP
jgi:hypothetical protein